MLLLLPVQSSPREQVGLPDDPGVLKLLLVAKDGELAAKDGELQQMGKYMEELEERKAELRTRVMSLESE